jgi:DNA primase
MGSDDSGEAKDLADILSESTYLHAGFARPGRGIDQARQGWKSIRNKDLQEQLQVDLHNASRRYAEDASDENHARLMALRHQIESMMTAMRDEGMSESA